MLVLGIDQSYTSTGFVVLDSDKNIIDHGIIKSNPEDDMIQRARFIADQLVTIALKHKPKKIALEGLAFGSKGDATRDLGGLFFLIVDSLRHRFGFEISVIPPTTLKKFATGNGRAKKQEMYSALPEQAILEMQYLKTKGMYDVTDAYWICSYLIDSP